MGVPHEVKGETVWCFVVLKPGIERTDALGAELRSVVAEHLGKSFAPSKVVFVDELPKTRSAKIVRRAIRALAVDEDPGDLSSLENPRLARRDPRRTHLTRITRCFVPVAGGTQPLGEAFAMGGDAQIEGRSQMKLDTRTKANALADHWRATHNVKRADRLDEENDRLRTELRMTTSQLERERDRQQDVLDALNRASERKTKVTAKPRGGLLRLIIVGGTAYVFGTKAGRDRYEQMRGWVSSMKDRMQDPLANVDTSAPGIGPKSNPLTESGIGPANGGSRSA